MALRSNKLFLAVRRFTGWLSTNLFWVTSLLTCCLAFYAAQKDNALAAAAFTLVAALLAIAGIYDANVRFTKRVLTEYDRILQSQLKRKGLRVIKGGKGQ